MDGESRYLFGIQLFSPQLLLLHEKKEESTIFFLVSILMSTTKSSETKFSWDNSTISSAMLQEIRIGWDREEVKPHANNYNTSCKEKM